jgi:hypothetical protein
MELGSKEKVVSVEITLDAAESGKEVRGLVNSVTSELCEQLIVS